MEEWSYIWKENLHTTIESYINNLIYQNVFSFDVFKIKAFKFYYKYSQKHYPFILIQYSPKLLIDKIMELDNNQFKFFIDIQLEPI